MTQMDVRSIALEQLVPSPFAVQAERRAHYDKGALDDLADNIKAVGIIQPIVVRKVNGHFEIIAGERRWLAARKAELAELPAVVRELDDQHALEAQLVENLQREGLHELAEAEGYEMLMKQHGYEIDQLVAKVGKSRSYVYARLKLLALCQPARKAFYAGDISASVALLIARIPVDKLQKEALGRIVDRQMSYRDAQHFITEDYTLRLDQAGFPTGDADLLPSAGPCTTCPKRTGNQPELFGDIKRADVCVDPVCFKEKREASNARRVAKAKELGQDAFTGKAASKIVRYEYRDGEAQLADGFARPSDVCYEDPKRRTYKQLLGKEHKPTLVELPQSGVLIEVVNLGDAKKALADKGVKLGVKPRNEYQSKENAAQKKAKLEADFRAELHAVARANVTGKLSRELLNVVARAFYTRVWNEGQKKIVALWGFKLDEAAERTLKKSPYRRGDLLEELVHKKISGLSDADLSRFLIDCAVASDLTAFRHGTPEPPEYLEDVANLLGVDPKKERRTFDAAIAATAKTAKKKRAKAK